ncbi:NucA/NucB deoxyribonuclease domain-containing protein [Saccharothrix variisporea]|uniref:Deoxyribonuclease NucA/NucB n=1 Tax=Saccharothrix variisporea TaxID=543527 RepID=A0A495X702_9PSEU|nr:NucA/NucB deoxyribonuclease domain-containing protein [Saccharothrix variisporea]RKT69256.1 deoxyribonuclease NucA/NucB [Saccharothrix variisporea]
MLHVQNTIRRATVAIAVLAVAIGSQAVAVPSAHADPGVRPAVPRPASPIVLSTSDQTIEYFDFNGIVVEHVSKKSLDDEGTRRSLPYLSGMSMGNVSAVETHDGAMQVFTVVDGAVWTSRQQGKGGTWSGWVSIGGSNLSFAAPAVTRGAGEALWVFTTAADGSVRAVAQQVKGGPWGAWTSLGGSGATGTPAVGRGPGDLLEVFVNTTSRALWKSRQSSGGFGVWEQFTDTGFAISGFVPQVITRADRSLEVMVRKADSTLATRRQIAPGGAWAAWSVLAGHTGFGRPAVILGPDGALDVLSSDAYRRVFHGRFGVDPTTRGRVAASGWQDFVPHGAPATGRQDLSGAGLADGSWIAVYNDDTSDAFAAIVHGADEVSAQRAEPAAPPLRPLAEVRAEDGRPGHYAEGVTAKNSPSATGWTPPAFQYDHFTLDQCKANVGDKNNPGTAKNHYSYCWSHQAVISFRPACWLGGLFCVERNLFYTLTVIGDGSDASREVRYDVFLTDFQHARPFEGVLDLTVEAKCHPLVGVNDCEPDPATPPVKRPLGEWVSSGEVRLKLRGPEPALDPLLNPERLGYASAWVKVTGTLPQGSTRDITSVPHKVRFDSADYISHNGKAGAIFTEVEAVLNFPVNRPEFAAMTQAAHHYRDAMTNPAATIPAVPGKQIPGAIGGQPLHRLWFDSGRRAENNREAVKTCRTEFPNDYPQPGQDCDEYPFASTYEGASPYYNPQRNFSVRVLPSEDNQAAGLWLAVWYSYDRILDNDKFFVRASQPDLQITAQAPTPVWGSA